MNVSGHSVKIIVHHAQNKMIINGPSLLHTQLSHCSGPWCRKAWVLEWWKCHRRPVRQHQMRRLKILEPDSSTSPYVFSPQHLSVPTTIRAQLCSCNDKSNPWDAPEMHKKRKRRLSCKTKDRMQLQAFLDARHAAWTYPARYNWLYTSTKDRRCNGLQFVASHRT